MVVANLRKEALRKCKEIRRVNGWQKSQLLLTLWESALPTPEPHLLGVRVWRCWGHWRLYRPGDQSHNSPCIVFVAFEVCILRIVTFELLREHSAKAWYFFKCTSGFQKRKICVFLKFVFSILFQDLLNPKTRKPANPNLRLSTLHAVVDVVGWPLIVQVCQATKKGKGKKQEETAWHNTSTSACQFLDSTIPDASSPWGRSSTRRSHLFGQRYHISCQGRSSSRMLQIFGQIWLAYVSSFLQWYGEVIQHFRFDQAFTKGVPDAQSAPASP